MPVIPADQRTRRGILIAAALLLMLVPALSLRHLPATRAQATAATGTCAAPTGLTTTCTLTVATTTADTVAAGGTMTIQITNPAGAVITSITGLPAGCSVSGGAGTAFVTIACAIASNGIPQPPPPATTGVALTEDVTFPSSTGVTPFVAETVVFNANGPSPAPLTTTGSCGPLPAVAGAPATCVNIPGTTTSSGGTVTLTIAAASGQSVSINAPGDIPADTYGSCPLTSPTSFPTPDSTSVTVEYTCGTGETTPLPSTPLSVTVSNGNGVAGTPTEVTSVTPSSTTPGVSATFPCPSFAVTPPVGAQVTCAGTTPATTQAGGTLALTVTGAVGQTLAITSATASTAGCPFSLPFPTSYSFPGGPVSVAYSCGAASSIPAGLTFQATVTNGNGVGGAPQLTITANAPNPSAAPPIPAPITQAVVFTVTPATPVATITAGQGLQVTITVPGQLNLVPGQAVQLQATATSSNEVNTSTGFEPASIVSFTFAFSDGSPPVTVLPTENSAGASANGQTLHTFSGPGPYIAYVQAVDSTGATGTAAVAVNIKPTVSYAGLYQPLPPAQAAAGTSMNVTLTAVPMIAGPGALITFSFTAVTEVNPALAFGLSTGQPQSGAAPPAINGRLDFGDGSPVQVVGSTTPVTHIYASPGAYNATLSATDSFGNTGQQTVQVVITAPVPQLATPASGTSGAPAPLSPSGTPSAGS